MESNTSALASSRVRYVLRPVRSVFRSKNPYLFDHLVGAGEQSRRRAITPSRVAMLLPRAALRRWRWGDTAQATQAGAVAVGQNSQLALLSTFQPPIGRLMGSIRMVREVAKIPFEIQR